jgi:hypothetical protein
MLLTRKVYSINTSCAIELPRSSSILIMVGVIHRDPEGYKRLYSLLSDIRPQVITVEISPLAVTFRKKQGPRLLAELHENLRRAARELAYPLEDVLKNSHIAEIREQIKLPFEYQAALDYSGPLRIPVLPVDISRYSRVKLAHFQSLICLSNLKSLLKLGPSSFQEKVKNEYSRAAAAFRRAGEDLLVGCPSETPREWEIREGCMARRIGRAVRFVDRGGGGTVLHVGGWMHLLEGRLYCLLSHAHPHRHLLDHHFHGIV